VQQHLHRNQTDLTSWVGPVSEEFSPQVGLRHYSGPRPDFSFERLTCSVQFFWCVLSFQLYPQYESLRRPLHRIHLMSSVSCFQHANNFEQVPPIYSHKLLLNRYSASCALFRSGCPLSSRHSSLLRLVRIIVLYTDFMRSVNMQ